MSTSPPDDDGIEHVDDDNHDHDSDHEDSLDEDSENDSFDEWFFGGRDRVYDRHPSRSDVPSFRIDPAIFISGDCALIMGAALGCRMAGYQNAVPVGWVTAQAYLAHVLAEDLGMPISTSQALHIAQNSLFGQKTGTIVGPVPLTPKERAAALVIHYYAWRAWADRRSDSVGRLTDNEVRVLAEGTVTHGERGPTIFQKAGGGCVPALCAVAALVRSSQAFSGLFAFAGRG